MISIIDAKDEHLEKIIKLQVDNFKVNLNEKEILDEGFVTLKHTVEMLKEMCGTQSHTIALCEDEVVAYALTLTPENASIIPDLKPMLNLIMNEPNFVIMGQICVDKNYRKQGIFRLLYERMKDKFQGKYEQIITEVSTENKRSLNAHYHIGFEKLGERSGWVLVSLKV